MYDNKEKKEATGWRNWRPQKKGGNYTATHNCDSEFTAVEGHYYVCVDIKLMKETESVSAKEVECKRCS